MKKLTVIGEPLSVRRSRLLRSTQQPGEHVRQYVARLRGNANVCQWTKSAQCVNKSCSSTIRIDYTDDMVKLVLLNGLCDDDIRREVLGSTGVDDMTLGETVAFIDS